MKSVAVPPGLSKFLDDVEKEINPPTNRVWDNHPTRVPYDNPKMYRWKSWEPQTPFAPSFDVPIYLDSIDTTGIEDVISNKMLEDWTTYNIIDWDDQVIKNLADQIYQTYVEYITELCYDVIPKNKLWIRGWGVRIEPDDRLMHHAHAFHENTYLSGNLSLSNLDTTTDYLFPYLGWYFGYWKVKNIPGTMTLFPSWVEHMVNTNDTKQVRFSLGFDLFTEQSISYISKNRNKNSGTQNILLLSKLFSEI